MCGTLNVWFYLFFRYPSGLISDLGRVLRALSYSSLINNGLYSVLSERMEPKLLTEVGCRLASVRKRGGLSHKHHMPIVVASRN